MKDILWAVRRESPNKWIMFLSTLRDCLGWKGPQGRTAASQQTLSSPSYCAEQGLQGMDLDSLWLGKLGFLLCL